MIGLDTNVVLRYMLADDRQQFAAAAKLINETCSESAPGFVGSIVLAELWWVLRRKLKLSKVEAAEVIRDFAGNPHIRVHQPEAVIAALGTCLKTNADFADCLIVFDHKEAGASPTVSFDGGALEAGIMASVPEQNTPVRT